MCGLSNVAKIEHAFVHVAPAAVQLNRSVNTLPHSRKVLVKPIYSAISPTI